MENVLENIVNSWELGQELTFERLLQHTKEEWKLTRRNQAVIYNHCIVFTKGVLERNGGWTKY